LGAFCLPNTVFGQKSEEKIKILFIKDFSAKDYYVLKSSDPKDLHFEIVESCTPMGLLAIRFDEGYDDKEARDHIEKIILKLISKNAGQTSYTIGDLRIACSEYRKEISDD